MMQDTLARKLRVLRAERGLTLRDVERLTSVDKDTLSKIERGVRHPQDVTLARIAKGYGIPFEQLLEEPVPLVEAPGAGPEEETFEEVMNRERRGGLTEADFLERYEEITRGYRSSWRIALEGLVESGEKLLSSGVFERGRVEQFFSDVAAVSQGVAEALRTNVENNRLRSRYKPPVTAEGIDEIMATDFSVPAVSIIALSDKVYAAASKRFSESELELARRKRGEARRALGLAA